MTTNKEQQDSQQAFEAWEKDGDRIQREQALENFAGSAIAGFVLGRRGKAQKDSDKG